MIVRRVLGAGLALVVCAWFVVGLRQAQGTTHAEAFVTTHQHASRAEGHTVRASLSEASLLNPDTTVTLLRGRLAGELGQSGQAARLITPITRQEPQNLDAWLSLAYVSGHDPAVFARALAQVKRLDPLGG